MSTRQISPNEPDFKAHVSRLVQESEPEMMPSRSPNAVWVLDEDRAVAVTVAWGPDEKKTSIMAFPHDAPLRTIITLGLEALEELLKRCPEAAEHPFYGNLLAEFETGARAWAQLGEGSCEPVYGGAKIIAWHVEGTPLKRVKEALERNIARRRGG